MKKYVMFLFALIMMINPSCKEDSSFKEDNDGTYGLWSDIIKFSTTELAGARQGGEYIITSEGNWWWILDDIVINDQTYYMDESTDDLTVSIGKFDNLNPSVIYDQGADEEIRKIEYEWFTITKENAQKLIIDLAPNDTGKERFTILHIEAGNYFTSIKIKQDAGN